MEILETSIPSIPYFLKQELNKRYIYLDGNHYKDWMRRKNGSSFSTHRISEYHFLIYDLHVVATSWTLFVFIVMWDKIFQVWQGRPNTRILFYKHAKSNSQEIYYILCPVLDTQHRYLTFRLAQNFDWNKLLLLCCWNNKWSIQYTSYVFNACLPLTISSELNMEFSESRKGKFSAKSTFKSILRACRFCALENSALTFQINIRLI